MTFLVLALLISITASSSSGETVGYTYDGLNRLEQVQYPDGTIIRYSYDNVGNRLEKRVFNIDLAVTGFTAPTDAHLSQVVTVSTTVRNQGGSPSGPFYVGIYLSEDTPITTSDRLLGYEYASGLAAGAQVTFNTSITIPVDTTLGPYFIGAIADYSGAVMESNEANNTAAGSPTTIRLPILSILKAGTGSGTVETIPANLFCGATCSGYYYPGSQVTLTATPSADSLFAGWSGGGCGGLDNCNVVVNSDLEVTAVFSMIPPLADFSGTPLFGVDPLTVTFTNLSIQNPTSWQWDFGDGTTSNLQNPTHAYANIGNRERFYTVTLTATNAGGSNAKVRTGYVHVLPSGKNRINGADPVYYPTLQAAYDAASDGSVIQCAGETFNESVNLNRNITVTLDGGYSWDFTSQAGNTVLRGSITISNGTVTIQNFKLDP